MAIRKKKIEKLGAFPTSVSPMLCTLTKEVTRDEDYIHEIKWDGYRLISFVNKKKVRITSRSGLDYTSRYPLISEALAELKHNVVLDGEAVVFNAEGRPDFDALQLYNGHRSPIAYCVFDILWLDGRSLKELPLLERKDILLQLVRDNEVIRFSESFDDGIALYDEIKEHNLEGIVSKKKDSPYREGARGSEWLKTPTRVRQEFVIGGWAESEKDRSFRSLLFGAYKDGKLEWIGRSGGGYKEKEMPAILNQLRKLEIKSTPFVNPILDTKGAKIHYVKPELVANFEFATWTKSGRIRKPATFLGFRKDKKVKEVVREIPLEKKDSKPKKPSTMASSNWPKLESIAVSNHDQLAVDGCEVPLSDVEREIWKGITKADLIRYYNEISNYILPYLKNRPLSLHVKPINAVAPGLYIKDMEGRQPDCAELFTVPRKHKAAGKRSVIDYLVCNNLSTLLYLINLGCIDINPWASTVMTPEYPDYLSIDLDPTHSDDDEGFKMAVETALAAKDVLHKLKLKSFIKTSGKTGLHVYVPCNGIKFGAARQIAAKLCDLIHTEVASISTRQDSIELRGDKVFIDDNQNDYADTLAAPYCTRPYKLPLVSTPLEWREVKSSLNRAAFRMDTIIKRLQKKGDLFSGVYDLRLAQANTKILMKL